MDQALRKALQIAGDLGLRTHYGDGMLYGRGTQDDKGPMAALSAVKALLHAGVTHDR